MKIKKIINKYNASLSLFQIANIEPHCYYSKSQSHYLTILLLKITQTQNNLTIGTKGNTRSNLDNHQFGWVSKCDPLLCALVALHLAIRPGLALYSN
jgi:hypothetical protein